VHLDVRFLEGRAPEIKQAVGNGAVELLHDHFALALDGPDPLGETNPLDVQITVEIQDIQRASYFKYPPGTLGPPSLSLV